MSPCTETLHRSGTVLRSRAYAQIELMLCMGLIVLLLLLVIAIHTLQEARTSVFRDARQETWDRAVIPHYYSLPPLDLSLDASPNVDHLPASSMSDGLRELPRRRNPASAQQRVLGNLGKEYPIRASVSATTTLPSPAWTLHGWPDLLSSRDGDAARRWFDDAEDAVLGDVRDGLRLAE